MPRPPRIEFENAWYHLMNRGAGRKSIFPSDELKLIFINLLGEICEEFRIEIHGYCLMGNHFHLLVKTPERNLNLAIQKLTSSYSRKHNRWMRTDGPLFKGRYKAILIAEQSYLAQVSRYIHRNPIEAKLVSALQGYRWSSFPAYCSLAPKPSWLQCDEMIGLVSPNNRLSDYIQFVENDGLISMADFYNSPRLPGVLGSKAARELVEINTGYHDTWYPEERIELSDIIKRLSLLLNTSEQTIMSSGSGRRNPNRALAMHIAQVQGRYKVQEIADWMKVKPSSVTQALATFRQKNLAEENYTHIVQLFRNGEMRA